MSGYSSGCCKDYSGLNLLLTEDNALYAQIMAELLRLRRATVRCAKSGEEALRLFAEERGFDAVLMDVHMPGMDGYETTRAIRAMEHGDRRVPILALTGETGDQEMRIALDAGMNGFLSKPLELAALDRALEQVLWGEAS